MSLGSPAAPGTFSAPLLATTDPTGAVAFYGELFGWSSVGKALPRRLSLRGSDVAGVDRLDPQLEQQGVPSHWRSFVFVDDAAATAARAAELGGTALGPPRDLLDWARVAPVIDPQGAMLAHWEPRGLGEIGTAGEPGSVCLTELSARDAGAAHSFYTALLGWTAVVEHLAGVDYTTFDGSGLPGGAMQPQRPEWGDAPSVWLPYFRVESCDTAASRIEARGAKVVGGPDEHPRGRFAVAHDPQDAAFGVLEMAS